MYGRTLDEAKLSRLRSGIQIEGRLYGPYPVEVQKRQTSNTWLHMKLKEGKNNEIRKVMEKL